MAIKLIIFLAGSIFITSLSRNYLVKPSTHGFFRFFAFESILALVLINIQAWFRDPFGVRQIFSWLFLLVSLILAIHSFLLLKSIGKPQNKIENTTVLVTQGAYRYIRHPLYSSLLYLAVGAYLKQPTLPATALLIGTFAFLLATARVEEAENLHRFGHEYANYMKNTKLFIPLVF